MLRGADFISGKLRPSLDRLDGRIGELQEGELLRCARRAAAAEETAGPPRATRTSNWGRSAWRARLSIMLVAQAVGAVLRQHALEMLAVALRFHFPGGHGAPRVEPVGAVEGKVLEEHAIEIHFHQRPGRPPAWGAPVACRCEPGRLRPAPRCRLG